MSTPLQPSAAEPNDAPSFNTDEAKLVLLDYWRSIRKRLWAILGFALVIGLAAVAVVSSLTPVYRATTTLLVENSKAKVVSIEDVYSGISQNREYFQTQVEIIKSREVGIRAVKALQLWNEPQFDPRRQETGTLQEWKVALGLAEPQPTEDWTEDELAEVTYERFKRFLTVEPTRLSQLAKVHFESPNPQLAARVANTIGKTYVQNDIDAKVGMTQQANEWLTERTEELKRNVRESEAKLQAYRERTGMIDAKGVAQSGAALQINDLTTRLTASELRRSELDSAYRQIKSLSKESEYGSIPYIVRAPAVAEARRVQSDLERKLSEVSQRYGAEHPRYVAAKAEVDSAAENVRRQMDSVADSVVREYELALATERSIQQNLSRARGAVVDVNRKEYELQQLEREVQSNSELLELFMRRSKETRNAVEVQSAAARVVDTAVVPKTPIRPQKTQLVLIAMVIGLVLAAAASIVLDSLDNTLKTTTDVDIKLRAPLLTTLPKLTEAESRRQSSVRLYLDQPVSNYAEAIRSARTGVLLSALDAEQRVLLVTSALPGEGKTTVAANLALAHAQTQRTLLIDADMRRPGITRGMDLPPSTFGLSELVAGTRTLDECIQAVDDSTLHIIPAGVIPPNPLELLISKRFRDTLKNLASQYEVIVIDSPPIELVSDAQVIAPLATGVIFVTSAMQTPIPIVRKGLEKVRKAGGPLIGVVLNKFDVKKAETYYGEYSGYGKYGGKYGYKGGYGAGGTAYGGMAYGAENIKKA